MPIALLEGGSIFLPKKDMFCIGLPEDSVAELERLSRPSSAAKPIRRSNETGGYGQFKKTIIPFAPLQEESDSSDSESSSENSATLLEASNIGKLDSRENLSDIDPNKVGASTLAQDIKSQKQSQNRDQNQINDQGKRQITYQNRELPPLNQFVAQKPKKKFLFGKYSIKIVFDKKSQYLKIPFNQIAKVLHDESSYGKKILKPMADSKLINTL